jgi:predicted ATPase
MMMDMFAAELRRLGIPVRRSHFHEFMLDVHEKLHAFHKALLLLGAENLILPEHEPLPRV